MTHNFHVGQTLIATDPCTLKLNGADALIIGKKYKIKGFNGECILIKSEEFKEHEFPFNEVFNYFKLPETPRYKGTIEPLRNVNIFWLVWVEGSIYTPKIKHETYDEAFAECQRLSKKENKTAYVLKAEKMVEQISNVIQLK